jgi:hypothetical protein
MTPRQLVPMALLVALLLGGVAWWHFSVRPAPLPAAEARALLADHSVLGAWGSASRKYALYLAPDGAAIYQEQGQAVTQGSWSLADDGTVCLSFPAIPANCYGVGWEGATLAWILPGSGRTYPFATRPGRIEGL